MKLWTACALAGALTSCMITPTPSRPLPRMDAPAGDPEEKTQAPYFFVKSEDSTVDQLPLKGTRAQVAITGVIAEVKVTQTYRNQGSTPLEAIYVFPGSTRAAVNAMTMTIGSRVLRAQIQEREKARATYETAKREGRTASLLEQQRPNVFQMNVGHILPGDEIQVELTYTELLVPSEGVYEFVFPTVVGPRYAGRAGSPSATGETWVANPHTAQGVPPMATFDLKVDLAAGLPIQDLSCATHPVAFEHPGPTSARVVLTPTEVPTGNRDFILKYRLTGGQINSGLLLHRGASENFFLLMVQPPKRVASEDMPPREYVFIMDVSGSQSGFPLEISKSLMKEMLEGLRPQDRFNVMVFEFSSALWAPESRPATRENIREAVEFVRAQNGGGGTELAAAMTRALTLPRIPDVSRTFVVSTDGYISADASLFDLIRRNLGSANLFTFGIGSSVNRFLIEGMAHAGQGEAFVLTRPEQAARTAARFRAYVSTPVLSQVKLAAQGFEIYDVEPLQLPDVLAERPILCFGKWKGEPRGTLTLSGATGRGPWQQSFRVDEVEPRPEFAALRQLWARQRLQLLSDYNLFGETEQRKQEITRLGLTYTLLTAHTSFVAVDSLVRRATRPEVEVRQPLPLPQGVSNQAVGNLAPGTSMRTSVSSGAACVEVVASSPNLGGGVSFQRPSPIRSGAPTLHLGSLQANRRDLPLARIRGQLIQRLTTLSRAGSVKGLPQVVRLHLQVDASGAITTVSGAPGSTPGLGALISLLKGWRFEAWATPGLTELDLVLEVKS
jgi:Ca-activated chloride channel family protein